MDNKIYNITLADGTVIDDLRLNGNNYISKAPIAADMSDYNCSPIVISYGEHEETHSDMELVQITEMNGEYWFVLRDISEQELAEARLRDGLLQTQLALAELGMMLFGGEI